MNQITHNNTSTPTDNNRAPIIAPVASIEQIAMSYKEYLNLKSKLLNESDYMTIAGKQYMKKSGYRKLSLAFGISTEIIHQERKDLDDRFVYTVTVKATSPSGRYMTASGACASTERKFVHIDHDCYSIAGTRATNRAISDLLGTGECSFEEIDTGLITNDRTDDADIEDINPPFEASIESINEDTPYHSSGSLVHKNNTSYSSEELLTSKQRKFLISLIERRYQDEKTRSSLFSRLNNLTKDEAKKAISQLLSYSPATIA